MSLQKTKSINREMERLDLTLLSLEKKKWNVNWIKKTLIEQFQRIKNPKTMGKSMSKTETWKAPTKYSANLRRNKTTATENSAY